MAGFRGLTVGKLARRLNRPARTLHALQSAVNDHYRLTEIKIGSKVRTLSIPSPPLMMLQRDLLKELFYVLTPLDCLGHVRRRGQLWTLRRHQAHPALFHADIKDFFPSVTCARVESDLMRLGVRPAAATMIAELVTFRDQLPQGAPTSVAVGDVVLFRLDCRIRGLANKHGLTYTRYIDDLALSGSTSPVERFARELVAYLEDDGWARSDKGGFFGPNESHRMLNALVNEKPNVTPEYYNSVRDQLRRIARFEYRPEPGAMDSLAAKVVWIAIVNPDRHRALLALLEEALQQVEGRVA